MPSNNSLQSRVNYDQIIIRTLEHQVIDYKKRILELEKIVSLTDEEMQEFKIWLVEKRKQNSK